MNNDTFLNFYNRLNPEQKLAVDTIDGPVMVIAGPGTGKTQLLATRVANILRLTDVLPGSILCLTFTDNASANMRQRLSQLIGREAYKVAIHTFHSFGTEIINQNPDRFFFGGDFSPADPLAKYSILRDIFSKLNWDNPLKSYHEDHDYTYLNDSVKAISALKSGGVSPQDFVDILNTNQTFIESSEPLFNELFASKIDAKSVVLFEQVVTELAKFANAKNATIGQPQTLAETIYKSAQLVILETAQIESVRSKTKPLTAWKNRFFVKNKQNRLVLKDAQNLIKHQALADIYEKYQKELFKAGLFDFDDMLLEVVKAFEDPKNIDLKYNVQEKYQYILVDEFQDTNGVQTKLLRNLLDNPANNDQPNILTVGDDDQAIFKFQGANLLNIFSFTQSYPTAKVVNLNHNYRSKQQILNFASEVIEQSQQRLSHLLNLDKKLISQK